MKEIKLFVDFEFTSLSPDAQPISVGIISENCTDIVYTGEMKDGLPICTCDMFEQKSFYAEFTDFDINRCDDWVKENVVSKLKLNYEKNHGRNGGNLDENNNPFVEGDFNWVKSHLLNWLSQLSDYRIQFVVDCGTWDWYWLVKLLAEWDKNDTPKFIIDADNLTKEDIAELNEILSSVDRVIPEKFNAKQINTIYKSGLPKLPKNISPVPIDLNDMIAHNRGISASEAFELNREELATGVHSDILCNGSVCAEDGIQPQKHNALWDAKVMLSIYNSFLNKRQFVFIPK